jgi:uncharacterized Zn-binding protein involved in type VI secretion
MVYLKTAVQNLSSSKTGQIVGNVAKTVFMDGELVVLEGSVNSAGATVLAPISPNNVFVEGRVMSRAGDTLSDGTIILDRK